MMHEQHYKEVVAKSPEHAEPREQAQVIQAVRHADQEVSVPGTSTETDGLVASTTVPVTPWFQSKSLLELKMMQEEDPDIEPVHKGMTNDREPSSQDMAVKSPAARHYWILWDSLVLQDGLLGKMFVKKDGTGEHMQFIIPKALKKESLFQMHGSLLSGHLGCKKTKAKTLQRFNWYGLKDDIGIYIKKCDTCAADKKPTKIPRAPMGSLQVGAPGDCVSTDYLGPLPVTDRGNRHILLFTDHFTKNVEVIPVADMTAEVCADKLLNEVISRWGCPLQIHSDLGRT